MRVNPFRNAVFVCGAPGLPHLPPDHGREVAFAGRSNVGKSTLINTLAGQRHLVRTSRTPGRTREINFFEVRPGARLVDLPGYGYARVSKEQRQRWGELMAGYLESRQSLAGVVVIMDIRHPFRELDEMLLDLLSGAAIPFHLVFNKSDTLPYGRIKDALRSANHAHGLQPGDIQVFSSVDGSGVDELRGVVQDWLDGEEKKTAPVHRGR